MNTQAKEKDGVEALTPDGIFQVGLTLGDGPEDKRDAALLALLLTIPLSCGRLADLRVGDVLGQDGVARDTLRATVCGETLEVPIFPVVGTAIERWAYLRRVKFRSPLFPGRDGRSVRRETVARWVRSRLAAAGIEGRGKGFGTVRNMPFVALNAGVHLAGLVLGINSLRAVRKFLGKPLTAADFAPLEELARLLLDARKLYAQAEREAATKEAADSKAESGQEESCRS